MLAILSARLRTQLARALPESAAAQSWDALAPHLSDDANVVVLFEPGLHDDTVAHAMRFHRRFPYAPLVMYTVLEPGAFQRVAQLMCAGITDVVLFNYDDTPGRLQRLVDEVSLRTGAPLLLEALDPILTKLPLELRSAIEDMMRHPNGCKSTMALASAAQMSIRALFRHLSSAGIKSPRRLVASARVFRAYQMLSDRQRTVQDAAAALGYPSSEQLSVHFSELAGCTAAEARRGIPVTELIAALVESVSKQRAAPSRQPTQTVPS